MNTKKLFLMVPVLLLAAGLVFTGCKPKPAAANSAASGGPVTLSIGMKASQFITDFETNYLTQYEGVFSPATFTHNQTEFRALMNSQPSVVGLAALGSHTGTWPAAV